MLALKNVLDFKCDAILSLNTECSGFVKVFFSPGPRPLCYTELRFEKDIVRHFGEIKLIHFIFKSDDKIDINLNTQSGIDLLFSLSERKQMCICYVDFYIIAVQKNKSRIRSRVILSLNPPVLENAMFS